MVSFQNNSSGAAYHFWDFGDGGTSTEVNPVHLYERNLTGHDTVYTVTLIVTSNEFCTDTMRADILVHPYIEAAFAVNDIVGCDPFTININNQSVGADYYIWDFGDGSPLSYTDDPAFQHTYYNPGNSAVTYPLQLIVLNEEGCSDTLIRYITVHPVITANYTATAFEGCHPLTVTFTDLSQNAVTYFWEFGDGASSTEPSPIHTFTNFGTSDTTYMVTLTTSTADGECVKSISWPVLVHGNVLAGFTIDQSAGCNPLEITLVNTSYGGSVYTWDFGDGTVINTSDPGPVTYTFTNTDFLNPRIFEVVLTAENDAGCTSQAVRNITVLPDIQALFDASSTEGCHPLSVDFTNLSNGSQTFIWDFGDGTSSNLSDPSHMFSNTGSSDSTYTVTLVTISPDNECQDSYSVNITVHPYINAEFTFEENYQCSPFALQLNNASVGGDFFHWDFGDGSDTTTTDLNPIFHTFNNSGFDDIAVFQVTLTATSNEGCSDVITRPVMVYPDILADFSMNIEEGCHPLQVEFTNLTNNGFYYVWEFGDGSTSTSESPVHTFTNFTDAPVTVQVHLTAISKYFCVSGITREVIIHPKPKALFETDRVVDCPPFDIVISNNSLNADHYRWNFGDGTSLDTDSSLPVNHIYDNLTGDILTYSIRLTTTSDFGCIDSAIQNINVYPRTIAAFSSNDEGCSPLTVYYTNESVLGESYFWQFGDGMTTSVKDPTHTYFNFTPDEVYYSVRLTSVSRYGCIDTINGAITVYPQPKAEFVPLPTHQTYPSATVSVDNITNPGQWSFLWDMDDGSTSTLEKPPPYTYSGPGEYDIRLYVSSTHCYDSVSHKIRIFPGPPDASFDTVYAACEPYTVQFTNTSLYGDSYLWEFDDGTTSTEFEPLHTFTHYGVYNVKLTVTGSGGRDYAYRQVEVYRKPVVSFRVAPDLVMLPDDEIQLYNMSEYGVQYLWDFGDGNISDEVNPRYLYSTLGTFDISLQVWTEHGCTDQLVKPGAVTVQGKGWIKFPNAFKPDMSGPNGGAYSLSGPEMDYVFHPFWEGVETYHLQIFNRWGVLIYTSYDVMIGWDGYYNGTLSQQGVYVYKCTGTFSNGKPFELVGDVTLLLHRR
jgi:PKD repeat protein